MILVNGLVLIFVYCYLLIKGEARRRPSRCMTAPEAGGSGVAPGRSGVPEARPIAEKDYARAS